METGQTFDLVEIIGDKVGYGCRLEMGQQCLATPNPSITFVDAHYVKFYYGHHTNPIVFYTHNLKKIGKFTITKVK